MCGQGWSMDGALGLSRSEVFLHKSQVKRVIQEILGLVKSRGCRDKEEASAKGGCGK